MCRLKYVWQSVRGKYADFLHEKRGDYTGSSQGPHTAPDALFRCLELGVIAVFHSLPVFTDDLMAPGYPPTDLNPPQPLHCTCKNRGEGFIQIVMRDFPRNKLTLQIPPVRQFLVSCCRCIHPLPLCRVHSLWVHDALLFALGALGASCCSSTVQHIAPLGGHSAAAGAADVGLRHRA